MAFPRLIGNSLSSPTTTGTRTVWLAFLVLTFVIALVVWRFLPRSQDQVFRPNATPLPAEAPATTIDWRSADATLHLAHAEQQLIAASEQLSTARRLLSELAPAMRRNYLEAERRRVDRAWTASENAQREIEQARDNIITVTHRDERNRP